MKLIVGLGNPGLEYRDSRHNVGFMVVDRLAREVASAALVWSMDEKRKAFVARHSDIILAKPQTFMNNSGYAIAGLVAFYKAKPEDVWVIHDDIDLPIGKIRIRQKGGSAGHNGVNSIIEHLKTDQFMRFRLGIGRGKEIKGERSDKNMHHRSVIQFVLSRFTQSEAGSLKHLVKHGAEAVRLALNEGIDKAMNRFN